MRNCYCLRGLAPTLLLALSLGLFTMPACGAIIIENLSEPVGGSSTTDNNSGKGVNFIMPAGTDYVLTSIVVGLSGVAGVDDASVELWSDEGGATPIAAQLEILTDPGTLADGLNTFTSSGTTLVGGTTYWVVVVADAGSFGWEHHAGAPGGNANFTSEIGALHTDRKFGNNPPSNYTVTSSVLNRLQVNAAVIPEPSSLALFAIAGCLAVTIRRKR